MFGLEQHISQTTHSKGHILDFIVSRQTENVLQDARVDSLFSDHYALLVKLKLFVRIRQQTIFSCVYEFIVTSG